MKKGDLAVILAVLSVSAVFFYLAGKQDRGGQVVISVNGEVSFYSLSDDRRIEFENVSGGHNTVVIRNGQVYMEKADCPDKLCVRHKAIFKNGECIICLPNEVFIEVESQIKGETDN